MDIVRIIQEAATWIEKVNPDYDVNLYRTHELNPKRHFHEVDVADMPAFVGELVKKRSWLLRKLDLELIPVDKLHEYGRVVLFNAWENVSDGAPEVESDYYVNLYDTPPYDTWIGLGSELNDIEFYSTWRPLDENVLLAWVPQEKYYCAKGAIEVACMDNFAWAINLNINDKYNVLNDVFSEPESIITNSPNEKIITSWAHRLDKYDKELNKASASTLINKKKTFWYKLFGK